MTRFRSYLKEHPLISVLFGVLLATLMMADSCNGSNANNSEANQVSDQQGIYVKNQPVPTFDYSLQRQMMIDFYTAITTKTVTTYSYVIDQYTDSILFSCVSVGEAIPGGTQLTNPQMVQNGYNGSTIYYGTVNQMEPDGLYSPANSAGTIVMCQTGNGKVSPFYFEDNVITSPVPLKMENGTLVPVDPNQAPTLSFSTDLPKAKPGK